MNTHPFNTLGLVHIGFDAREHPSYEAELRKLIDCVRETGGNILFMDVPTTSPQSEAERTLMMQVAASKLLQAFAITAVDEGKDHAERGSDHITPDDIKKWKDKHGDDPLHEQYSDVRLISRIYRGLEVDFCDMCLRWTIPFFEKHFPQYFVEDISTLDAMFLHEELLRNFDTWMPKLVQFMQLHHREKFDAPFLPVEKKRAESGNPERRERIYNYALQQVDPGRVHEGFMRDAQQFADWADYYEAKMNGGMEEHFDDDEVGDLEGRRWDDFGNFTTQFFRIQRDLYRLRQDQWIHSFGMMLPAKDDLHICAAGEYSTACVPRFCALAQDDFGIVDVDMSQQASIEC